MEITQHTSHTYNQELEVVRTHVLQMGGLVEEQLSNAVKALLEKDSELGAEVARNDYKVNKLEVAIDEECARIIARRQPAAVDLRLILTIIKSITDLERIGDEAEKIGRYAAEASEQLDTNLTLALRHLCEHVKLMLRDTLDAFARVDATRAMQVAETDLEIDREFEAIYRQLITMMMEDPRNIKHSLNVVWCARALERIGDHCCNVCEYVIYLVNGKDIRHTSKEEVKAVLANAPVKKLN
ncbi:MAG: phosphate signaling complex protein PhoU [Thiofilum sp.]|uniref:phosphate signaling complex protein PhoU n=1 Tax=Thiofilum sp. TaxID=2212733 RepID=UPI0025E50D8D|nr:phosphate signaling complex protein PhoU [Thiofilum sp.]MBK8453878.1 phosphate signaling complex protein PhoU [Thiofilum sp.]